MKLKVNKLLFLATITILLFVSISCRKYRFDHYNTIINITIPETCMDCFFNMYDANDKNPDFSDHSGGNDWIHMEYVPGAKNIQTIEINWDNVSTNPRFSRETVLEIVINSPLIYTGDLVATQTVKIKPKRIYNWNPTTSVFEDTGEKPEKKDKDDGSSGSNALIGKWMATSGCTNSSGTRNWFQFSSGGSGTSFSADCNNYCGDPGIKFYYNYSSTGSTVTFNWTSVDDFCGVTSATPSSNTENYSISGDVLTLSGISYKKQ